MKKYYVIFININTGRKDCHCFEEDEKQARHFSSLVNGKVVYE